MTIYNESGKLVLVGMNNVVSYLYIKCEILHTIFHNLNISTLFPLYYECEAR